MEEGSSFQFSETPSSKRKKVLTLAIILALIFLIGGIGALASRIYDPRWNPFRPNPDKVIEKIIAEMKKVKTWEEKISLFLLLENEEKSSVKIDYETKNDLSDKPILENEIKTSVKIDYETKNDLSLADKPKYEGKFDILVSTGNEIKVEIPLSGEIKRIDDAIYFKITNFPLSLMEEMGVDVSELTNKWIKIDEKSSSELEQKMEKLIEKEKAKGLKEEVLLEMKEKLLEGMKKAFQEMTKKEKEAMEDKERSASLTKNLLNFYSIDRELPDEKMGGKKVYHYLVRLDKNELLNFIAKNLESKKEMFSKEGKSSVSQEELKLFQEELKSFFEKLGEIKGEVWIGKKDYLIYKIKFEKEGNYEGNKNSFKFNLENSNYNQTVKIEAPKEYKDIGDVLIYFIEGILEKSFKEELKAKDATITTILTISSDIAKAIYSHENSYKNLCQNFSFNKQHPKYGRELKKIEEDIKVLQGGILKLSCFSSKDSYCVTADLVSQDKEKYCVDSSRTTKKIGKNLNCIGKGTPSNPYHCP